MKKKNVYINVKHLDYWWGIFGFRTLTNWEDVIIYEKKGNSYSKLGWFCICSKSYLRNSLDYLQRDEEELSFVKKIEKFLKHNDIVYHYYYDNPNDTDFHQLPYKAEKNNLKIKPSSIEIWYPSKGIDKLAIDTATVQFCSKFLAIEAVAIRYKDIINEEQAYKSHLESEMLMQSCKGIQFSDELVENLIIEWNVPKEKVLEILNNSVLV